MLRFQRCAQWMLLLPLPDQADVLIWGDVAKSDEILRLWFLSRESSTLTREARSSYALEKTELPKDFNDQFALQLVALAFSTVKPVTEQAGTYLAATLRPVAARLNTLRADPPAFFTPLQKADLHHSFALAALTIGEQAGDSQWRGQAVEAFRAALQERTRERVPLDWAATQNSLGNALWRLGEREGNMVLLEQAVEAYRAALDIVGTANVPGMQIDVQMNLDNVSSILKFKNS